MNSDPSFELQEPTIQHDQYSGDWKPPTVCSFIVNLFMGTQHGNNHLLPKLPEGAHDDGVWGHDFEEKWRPYRRSSPDEQLAATKEIINALPKCNFETLKIMAHLFIKISAHEDVNKMTPSKLGLCVFPAYQTPAVIMTEEYEAVFGCPPP